eukprot:6186339-Pleurochrysis_carterae.AAC.2
MCLSSEIGARVHAGASVIPVSATTKVGVDDLFDRLLAVLPEHEPYFPKDQVRVAAGGGGSFWRRAGVGVGRGSLRMWRRAAVAVQGSIAISQGGCGPTFASAGVWMAAAGKESEGFASLLA